MKKYIGNLLLAVLALTAFNACTEEEGQAPGNDSNPKVTLYQYEAGDGYNADNDLFIRIAANSAVKDCYYLVELEADKEARGLSDDAYADYVVSNGVKVNDAIGSVKDVYVTDLMGSYAVTVVGVNGNKKSVATDSFMGLIWGNDVKGTYYPAVSRFGASFETTLQTATNASGIWRFKDLYGTGYNLKFTAMGLSSEDEDGKFQLVRVQPQATPFVFTYQGEDYEVGVRDVAAWQGNVAYARSSSYMSIIYESNYVFLCNQYYVSIGNLGYGYDQFVPAAE